MTLSNVLGGANPPPLRLDTPEDWQRFRTLYLNDQMVLRSFLRKFFTYGRDTATGSLDHGLLTGLTDDDHTQYVKDATAAVTDGHLALWDGATGRLLKDGSVGLPLPEGSGGTGLASMPIPFHLEFYGANATAAGSSYYGYLNSVDTTSALEVPTGTTMKVLMATAYIKAGGSAGTFSVAPIIYNVTDASVKLLSAYAIGAASTNIYTNNKGTLASPITTLAAGKRFLVGWQNRASSPGALDGAALHHVIVSGYFTV